MRRFDAVICDLDGTLVDSADDLIAALDGVLGAHGRPAVGAAGRAMIGDGARVLVERGFAATGGPAPDTGAALRDFFRRYSADIARHSRPYPMVPETLRRLTDAGIRLAVCTNKAHRPSLELLRTLDLLAPFAVVHDIDSGAKKPDPAPVRATLAALGVAADRALMIGDSIIDVRAAHGAGVKVAAVSYGYSNLPVAALGADWVIDSFDQVAGLVTTG